MEIPNSPLELLLHVPAIPLSHYLKSLLPHPLNAARWLITIYSGRDRKFLHWMLLVDIIMVAGEWMVTCKDHYDKFYSIWAT